MSDSFLNLTGLSYYHNKIKALFATKTELGDKVDKVTGKGLSTNDYTTTEKNKLSNIAAGAEVNQNAFSNIKVGSTTVAADSKTDTVEFVGSGVTITPDATNDKITFTVAAAAVDSTVSKTSTNAVQNKAITSFVDGYGTITQVAADSTSGTPAYYTIKFTHSDGTVSDVSVPVVSGGKVAVSNLPVDTALSTSSVNPVQNKVINSALGNKANLASPTFTGTPKAPTAASGTNTTQIATTEFVTTAVANAIAGVTSISYKVVTSLPTTGENGVIYLVAHSHGTSDGYDEYIWVGSSFEKLGNTDIDLSGYMLKTDMVAITTAEIDTLFA